MELMHILLAVLLLACQVSILAAEKRNYHCQMQWQCGELTYNTSGGPVLDKINVHLVPHTHDDVGWLKTVDQYFVGSNNSIQVAAVQYILDSVISALLMDPNRKFIYVEQAFFQRWWRQQTSSTKKIVKKLVDNGQLEFINGGWCMHDEATTHYLDMIDQTTLGHRYIKQQFGKVPRIGWQIDPFGHSAVQAYLLGAEAGFDAVFFARADYQDVEQRRANRSMEVVWRASRSLGSSSQIFAGVLANHYEPPEGFSFDIDSSCPPIQDDPKLYDINVEERVNLFVEHALDQAKQFRTNHLMWTMGDDFAYEYAHTWFKQMDKLVHYVNKDGRINTFYSTPSIYVDMKNTANESWPLKTEDFFPYADSANGYWTGYFTSRPTLKGYVRKLSAFLQAARQLEFIAGRKKSGPNTDSLEEAMAILQHHDGVSGTEKQHVADDYAKRLSQSSDEAEDVITSALASIAFGVPTSTLFVEDAAADRDTAALTHRLLKEDKTASFKLYQCPLLNISYCPHSEGDLTGRTLVVIAYNPLGWRRRETVRITVSSNNLEVLDSDGNGVTSQILPIAPSLKRLRKQHMKSILEVSNSDESLFALAFTCDVPPLGYATYYVKQNQSVAHPAEISLVQKGDFYDDDVLLRSHSMEYLFSSSTGSLKHIKRNDGTVVSMTQSYCWYNASNGNTNETFGQASGAYVFRPNSSTCFHVGDSDKNVLTSVVNGPLVQELHQQFSSWISQVVRISKDADHAEVEFTVGPIPIDDDFGKEVVTKLSSGLPSDKVFFTDSNGRDFLKRVRDYRSDWDLEVHEEIAGNYYPVNSGIYLTGNGTDLSILVDRSIGGSSIADGELELMLHRRLLQDDNKGVAEALNETVCLDSASNCEGLVVQGTFVIGVQPSTKATSWRRNLIQRILSPLQIAFSSLSDDELNQLIVPQYSAMSTGYELPSNVAIITLQALEDTTTLLRLAHLFEVDEDDDLSNVATVDLQKTFAGRMIKKVDEMSLTANQKKSEMNPLTWVLENDADVEVEIIRSSGFLKDGFVVELQPMEIRTFLIVFQS